jgi:hypothetical protein
VNQALLNPSAAPADHHFPWYAAWTKALLQPSAQTYQTLLADPSACCTRAFIWVAAVGLGCAAAITLFGWPGAPAGAATGGAPVGGVAQLIAVAVLAPLAAVLGLAVVAGIPQLTARSLGGRGSFVEMIYAFGAFVAPMGPLALALSLVVTAYHGGHLFFLNPVLWALTIYGFFVATVIVHAVHGLNARQSLAAVIPAAVIQILLLICAMLALLTTT